MRWLPRFRAWPVTMVSAKLPAPLAVSLKLVSRILARPPEGNSRLEIQYAPDNVEFESACEGSGIAMKRSNMVAPASVEDPTSAPDEYRAFTVTPLIKGFESV